MEYGIGNTEYGIGNMVIWKKKFPLHAVLFMEFSVFSQAGIQCTVQLQSQGYSYFPKMQCLLMESVSLCGTFR